MSESTNLPGVLGSGGSDGPTDSDGRTTNCFTMDCPNCGPSTIRFEDGEQVPHGCEYEPPSLVIECGGDDNA